MIKTSIGRLRLVGLVEGASFLLLLFVAMPIKYIGGNPLPVKYVGMGHGVLFLAFLLVLLHAFVEHRWTIKFAALVFLSSLLPFGTFFMDKKLKELEVDAGAEGISV